MSLPSIAGPEPDIHTPPAPPFGVTFQTAGVGVNPAWRSRPRTSYATMKPWPGPRGFSPLIEKETTTALFPAASVNSPKPARIFWYGTVNPFEIPPPPLSALPAISTGGFLSASVAASRIQSWLLRSVFGLVALGLPNVVA